MSEQTQGALKERGSTGNQRRLWLLLLLLVSIGCAGPHLEPRSTPPRNLPALNPPPNGQPEPVRYREAYEAFWWNCAIVKSRDSSARCPSACSGTNGAALGCFQGGTDAENDIYNLVRRYGGSRTQRYLQRLVLESGAEAKIRSSYFTGGPVSESWPTGDK